MTAFHFGLEKVLELRKKSENESARGLAEARGEAEAARKAKADLEAAREAGRSRLVDAHGSGGAVGHLQNLAYVVDQFEAQIENADEACQRADENVVESLKTFHSAFRDRKTIEDLRARRHDKWRVDEERGEQKDMDEIALVRHSRAEQGVSGGGT